MKAKIENQSSKQLLLNQIRDILRSEPGEPAQITEIVRNELTDLNQIICFEETFPRHQLIEQALITADAMETVTNGINDPEVLNKLENLPDGSLFDYWRFLIKALKAMYDGDKTVCLDYASKIPSYCALGVLKPFFQAYFSAGRRELADNSLFGPFFDNQSPLAKSYLVQMTDELKAGLLDQFSMTALCFMKDFQSAGHAWINEICIFVMQKLVEEDGPFEEFIGSLQTMWPKSRVLFLAAKALKDIESENALVYMLQSINYCVKGSQEKLPEEDYQTVFESFIENHEIIRDYLASENELFLYVQSLVDNISKHITDMPQMSGMTDSINQLQNILFLDNATAANPKEKSVRATKNQSGNSVQARPVQLELF